MLLPLERRQVLCLRWAVLLIGTALSCQAPKAGSLSETQELQLIHDGLQRRYVLFVPATRQHETALPLWLLCPGSNVDPYRMLSIMDLASFASQQQFAVVVLVGQNNYLNVGVAATASADAADDVGYTSAVLQEVQKRLCIDESRIFCIGSSRGARFCSRLASELPELAGVAAAGGLRYPRPNNASRSVPIIAFHGTDDQTNPFLGGGPDYWGESMPEVVEAWASFNGCKETFAQAISQKTGAKLERYADCQSNGDIFFVTIANGKHRWPGAWALDMIWHVFERQSFLRTSNGAELPAMLGGPDGPAWLQATASDACSPSRRLSGALAFVMFALSSL